MHIPWIEFGASLLVAGTCIPLVLRKVARNYFYGMRTARTLNGSDENWFNTNHDVAAVMMWASLLAAAADLLLGFLPIPVIAVYAVSALLLLLAVIFPLVFYRKRLF